MRRRAYRALLALFPRRFRREHGRDMERLFEDMRADWIRERGRAGARFWASLALDALRHALGERLRPARRAAGSSAGEGGFLGSLLGDVRYGLRQAVHHPLYGGTIVLLLAVGIGGNAVVFRLVNGLFLRPLPFEAAERLVDLDTAAPAWNLEETGVSYIDFLAWREGNRSFEAMAVLTEGGRNLASEGGAERVDYLASTHDLDDVLGLQPVAGRFFTAAEDVPDGPRVALVTEGFWAERYGRDPDALGRTLSLDGETYEIIGVLPPQARFVSEADVWVPLGLASDTDGFWLTGVGRLLPGVTPERAREDLLAVHKAVEGRPENELTFPTVGSLRDQYLGEYRLGSGILLLAVGLVLVMACANIAGLVFARSLSRDGEMAVRKALGAPRGRVARQLLTESVVLAVAGGAAGAILGLWGSEAMVRALDDRFPLWVRFDLDGRVVTFLALTTMAATLLFGLAPALRGGGATLAPGGRATGTVRRRRWMNALVAGEVALASLLLVVGGLSLMDAWRLGRVDPGYATEGILTYRLQLPSASYGDREARLAFAGPYLDRLRAEPGVEAAALASNLPLTGHWGWFFTVDGAPARSEDEGNPVVLVRVVTPGYLETMGVTLVAGRGFHEMDGRDAGVAIVNETFVRTFFGPGEEAVGRRIATGTDAPDEDDWMTVVGVTRDVKHYGVDEAMRPGVYWPWSQAPRDLFHVALRTSGDPLALVAGARRATAARDPRVPPFDIRTMADRFDESLWTRRATSWLLAAFAGVALLLAVAGIYGVVSYGVAQRRREISIRMAMGAPARRVLRRVVGEGMALVALGLALGLTVAVAAGGATSRLFVGVSAHEPGVYAAVGGLLLLVSAVANYLPARRAAALDPAQAMRAE